MEIVFRQKKINYINSFYKYYILYLYYNVAGQTGGYSGE